MALQLELPEIFFTEIEEELRKVYHEAREQARRDTAVTKEWLTPDEVVDYYVKVSKGTLEKWIKNGLPTYKLDGKNFINRNELNNFIRKHKI